MNRTPNVRAGSTAAGVYALQPQHGPSPRSSCVAMRFHNVDWDSWYDSEVRVLWLIDDPYSERADDWNLWSIYDDHCVLTGTYWWWGLWAPPNYTFFGPYPFNLEVVEEGSSRPLDPDELLVRIRAREEPTTFCRAHRPLRSLVG